MPKNLIDGIRAPCDVSSIDVGITGAGLSVLEGALVVVVVVVVVVAVAVAVPSVSSSYNGWPTIT